MKIDKGFEWNYWNLSYRRKFIRTLWMIPLLGLCSVGLCYNDEPVYIKASLILVLIIIEAVQLIYNYKQYIIESERRSNALHDYGRENK